MSKAGFIFMLWGTWWMFWALELEMHQQHLGTGEADSFIMVITSFGFMVVGMIMVLFGIREQKK